MVWDNMGWVIDTWKKAFHQGYEDGIERQKKKKECKKNEKV